MASAQAGAEVSPNQRQQTVNAARPRKPPCTLQRIADMPVSSKLPGAVLFDEVSQRLSVPNARSNITRMARCADAGDPAKRMSRCDDLALEIQDLLHDWR